jgi:hypothetical protein
MKLEELPMREYVMYALGADHAEDFETYQKRFGEIFLIEYDIQDDDVKPAM